MSAAHTDTEGIRSGGAQGIRGVAEGIRGVAQGIRGVLMLYQGAMTFRKIFVSQNKVRQSIYTLL